MGQQFCHSLSQMSNPDQVKYKQALKDIESLFPEGVPDTVVAKEGQTNANMKIMQAAYSNLDRAGTQGQTSHGLELAENVP